MADEKRKLELIEQFSNLTGIDPERSRFYLESAAWNSETAAANFFEDGDEPEMMEHQPVRPPTPPRSFETPSQPKPSGKQPTKPPSQPSRFATLHTLRSDEDSSSDEEGQAFYAGGSEHGGGQQIIGPKKKTDPNALVADMFKLAKEHGAETVEPQGASSGAKRSSAFQGRAYRLGDDMGRESEVVGAPPNPLPSATVDVVLKFWQNGFSLDDGPLREFTDPKNKEFLSDIKNGSVPHELISLAKGSQVNLSMEDNSHQEYVKPKNAVQCFSGHGYRLGNPTDPSPPSASSSIQSSASNSAALSSKSEVEAAAGIGVNQSLATASLQIRLTDGSRLVAKFNHSHTIADVRRYVVSARPEYSTVNFVFMTTFPNQELSDESLTLAGANLLNAVLVVKLK